VWRRGKARLLRYATDKKTRRTPLLIVFWASASRPRSRW